MTRCLNASGMENKLEESEVCVQLQGYDLIRIMEMWWDSSRYWVQWMKWMNGSSLEREGGHILYVREQQECMELCLGMDGEPDGRLCVRISGQTNMADIVAGVCYRSGRSR